MTPSPHQFQGFFHGMYYAQTIAARSIRGRTGARAIGKEIATLKLLKEKKDVQAAAKAHVRFSEEYGHRLLADFHPVGRAFGEAGCGFESSDYRYERLARKARNYSLIALIFVAALMLTIHFSVV